MKRSKSDQVTVVTVKNHTLYYDFKKIKIFIPYMRAREKMVTWSPQGANPHK